MRIADYSDHNVLNAMALPLRSLSDRTSIDTNILQKIVDTAEIDKSCN